VTAADGQLVFDLAGAQAVAGEALDEVTDQMGEVEVTGREGRRYWEHAGPGKWRQVRVRVRYGPRAGSPPPGPVLPYVQLGSKAPQNVLVERDDGTSDVRPVRVLRTRRPTKRPAGRSG
jgi:hypothetical protein